METHVLRVIRAEIARLRRGRATVGASSGCASRSRCSHADRAWGRALADERSRHSEPVTTREQPERTLNEPGQKAGVLEAQAGGGDEQAQTPPLLPPPRDEVPFLLGALALAALILGFVGLVAGVTRHVLRSG
jgi:hypothetical protein